MHNALRLRKEVTELLLRDFGIRGKIYQEAHEARMDDLSREKFLRVIGHYDVSPADREELESIIYNCTYNEATIAQYGRHLHHRRHHGGNGGIPQDPKEAGGPAGDIPK